MFRALTCPSSGGLIVFSQHLVSSLSVNGCTVHRLRADSNCIRITQQSGTTKHAEKESALNQCIVQPFTESDVTRCCDNTIFIPLDGYVDAQNMSRIVM